MSLLMNYSGIGMSPRPKWRHQLMLSCLLANTFAELQSKGLTILPESTVTEDWNDLAPDLVIFDKIHHPLVIIEIAREVQVEETMDKCEELMTRFPKAEYFVYDYEQNIFYGFNAEDGEWITSEEEPLCSIYLERPLMDYLL